MKKYFSLIFLLTILFSGCNQEELLNNQSTISESRTFTASFEQNESRTYIEEGNLLRWTEGDQISLFEGNTLNRQYQFDGKTGDNSGTFSLVVKPFGTGNDLTAHYAVYPYTSDIKITETGVITATIPTEQFYAENSFGLGANTMVAVTENLDDTFLKFKNVGGYLKLQLYGNDVTVKTITLTGNNNEKLSGQATITSVYGEEPTISMADDATETITLNCGEGIKIGSTTETATTFWLAIPPTTFEKGFKIVVINSANQEFSKSTSNNIVINRNIIKPMAAFETTYTPDISGTWNCTEEYYKNSWTTTPSYKNYTITLNKDGSASWSEYENIYSGKWFFRGDDGTPRIEIIINATNTSEIGRIWFSRINDIITSTIITGKTYGWNYTSTGYHEGDHHNFEMTKIK